MYRHFYVRAPKALCNLKLHLKYKIYTCSSLSQLSQYLLQFSARQDWQMSGATDLFFRKNINFSKYKQKNIAYLLLYLDGN